MKTVSVVLPSYNEKDNIREAIERISRALGEQLLEIIVVDDNSPDRTWEIVQNLNNPKVKLICRMKEKGLASALDDGIKAAKGESIVWMDCDLGLPPEDVPKLVKQLDNYDIVIGSRYVKGGKDSRSKPRAWASTLLNIYASLILSLKVRDYTSGFVAVKREVFNKIQFTRRGFGEYFIDFVYQAIKNNYRIIEVGYIYKDRKSGISRSGSFSDFKDAFVLFKNGWQYGTYILKRRFSK